MVVVFAVELGTPNGPCAARIAPGAAVAIDPTRSFPALLTFAKVSY
jgi:hypothetical protein